MIEGNYQKPLQYFNIEQLQYFNIDPLQYFNQCVILTLNINMQTMKI